MTTRQLNYLVLVTEPVTKIRWTHSLHQFESDAQEMKHFLENHLQGSKVEVVSYESVRGLEILEIPENLPPL